MGVLGRSRLGVTVAISLLNNFALSLVCTVFVRYIRSEYNPAESAIICFNILFV
jgi:hypothetical protein